MLARLEGLARLPVRAQTARVATSAAGVEAAGWEETPAPPPRDLPDLDPGWLAAESAGERSSLSIVAASPWWAPGLAAAEAEAVQHLWRHAIATALACRSLAREHDDPDPAGLIRAGMLHGLGRWAVAAVDPAWFARWRSEPDRDARLSMEKAELGSDLRDVGRRLAERWGCEPLVVDAAWLHGEDDAGLLAAARDPDRIALVREAVRRAESTPWALDAPRGTEGMPSEPHLRILVAEVQSRCGPAFVAADASPFEEKAVREVARLRLRVAEMARTNASQGRLIAALADSGPDETPENWSLRAGRVWCGEPEVNAARVAWGGPDAAARPAEAPHRGASWTIPLQSAGEPVGEVQLWLDGDVNALRERLGPGRIVDAWKAWAAHVAGRCRLEARLAAAIEGAREASRSERRRLQAAKLDALAEFAAGAGHELNNPLAVIVGRAQLLASQTTDPDAAKALGIILNQARRTHRILRDLMFVARPSGPRPRACRPAEILRSTLSEFQAECEARGVRLTGEFEEADAPAWLDPDALRHVAEELVRNAMQAGAGPNGGSIRLRSTRQDGELRLWVTDSGKGIGPAEAAHLFDPFYCGRQAGRGLGLGLARAARIVESAGGSMGWETAPGQGSVFRVNLPCERPPEGPRTKIA